MKEKIKKYWYVFVLILCLFSIIYIYSSNVSVDIVDASNIEKEDVVNYNYYVEIKGEVVNPGVYEVSSNDRINDVIKKAGGLTKNAEISLINLSKKVVDEMNIIIYSKSEVKTATDKLNKEKEVVEVIKEIEVEKECICPKVDVTCSYKNDAVIEVDSSNESNSNLVNINTATKEELMTITGIGESKANNIIEYRKNNKFSKIEDIKNISGIGDSVFEKIKEYITI